MKLEVGMYVRYSNGIDKIMEVKNDSKERDVYHIVLTKDEIVFGSLAINNTIFVKEDLIDLIEERDIVQLDDDMIYEVGATTYFNDNYEFEVCIFDWYGERKLLKDLKIKSILTHEQYNSNKYVIGDDNNE